MSNPRAKKYCIVPMCVNTTNNAPGKLFFGVPIDEKTRKKWIDAIRRANPIGPKSTVYCCEDHFDIENDLENYVKYRLVGGRVKLKKGVVPHKFAWQNKTDDNPEKSAVEKINRIKLIEELLNEAIPSTPDTSEEVFVPCYQEENVIDEPLHLEGLSNLYNNATTEKKDNAPKVVPELERYRSRIIRSTARLIRDKKTPDEIWQIMKDETGYDCETLWNHMRAFTIRKLNRLIAADDRLENISPVSRLTNTDWLLFDLALVHEDIDVIGQKKTQQAGTEYKPMVDLFSLVQKFEIEDHIVSENYEELPKAWALATLHYNKGGRMCSPMLLQKRWFQVKEVTRAKFYGFWKLYRGNMNNLKTAKLFVPTKLQTAIAKRYQHLVTKNSISWEEAYERKAIVSPEELQTLMMKNSAGLKNPLDGDGNAPDIVLLEPVIETVTLDSDSESESKDEPSTSKDEITTKSESSQINIKKDVTEYLEDFQIDETDDTRIEGTNEKNHCLDNEEDRKLNFEKFNITIFDETSTSTTQIDNDLEISNTIIQERDEMLHSCSVFDSMPQIVNVISLGKSSSHVTVNDIGLVMPEDEKNDTKMTSDVAEDNVIITIPRRLFGDNEMVHNGVELNTELPANVDFLKDVIDYVNDDIEFIDDGTDESGNEEESGEHKAKDVDIVMKIDSKLPMTVEANLDDMFVLKVLAGTMHDVDAP